MQGNKAEFYDYIDLLLLRLAKVKRSKIASNQGTKEFYEEFFTKNDENLFAADGDPRRRHRGRILREAVLANTPAGGRLLDVGCGTGDNLRYVLSPTFKAYGIEYAESTAKMARDLLADAAEISVASATAIPFPDRHFDCMICLEVLEHIEDHEGALKEIARVLRPGGKLIMSVPYRHWFPSYFRLMGHFRHYTRTDVEAMLTRDGLGVVKHLENYPNWARWANYVYVTSRMYALLLRPFGSRKSAIDVPAPFSRKPLLDVLFERIEPVRQREIGIDYSKLDTSTFVLAERR